MSLVINKYVLSTLHFTIPTVFQAWQTLVCVILMTASMKWGNTESDLEKLDRRFLGRIFAPVLLFTLGNVAGSKALAELPIAVFASGTNGVLAILATFEALKKNSSSVKNFGLFAIFASFPFLYFLCGSHKTGWFWLLIHVISFAFHSLTIGSLKLDPITWIYYCNICSVVILLPLSIYLQDAQSALNHARHARLEFFIGCILSGVIGTGLQLLHGRLQGKPAVTFYQGVAKILACTLSLVFFPNDLIPTAWLLIVGNLVLCSFLFLPDEIPEIEKRKGVINLV